MKLHSEVKYDDPGNGFSRRTYLKIKFSPPDADCSTDFVFLLVSNSPKIV